MKQSLGLVSLVVRDYDEAIEFFVGKLGFGLVEDTCVPEQAKRWVVVSPPGASETRLLLAKASSPEQAVRVGAQTGGRVFLFLYTVTMVIMVVTGGKGTLAGPIVGGIIFGFVPEFLRVMEIQPEVQWIIYGVLMILVVYFLPQGIVPAITRYWASRKQGRDADALPTPPAQVPQQ